MSGCTWSTSDPTHHGRCRTSRGSVGLMLPNSPAFHDPELAADIPSHQCGDECRERGIDVREGRSGRHSEHHDPCVGGRNVAHAIRESQVERHEAAILALASPRRPTSASIAGPVLYGDDVVTCGPKPIANPRGPGFSSSLSRGPLPSPGVDFSREPSGTRRTSVPADVLRHEVRVLRDDLRGGHSVRHEIDTRGRR